MVAAQTDCPDFLICYSSRRRESERQWDWVWLVGSVRAFPFFPLDQFTVQIDFRLFNTNFCGVAQGSAGL